MNGETTELVDNVDLDTYYQKRGWLVMCGIPSSKTTTLGSCSPRLPIIKILLFQMTNPILTHTNITNHSTNALVLITTLSWINISTYNTRTPNELVPLNSTRFSTHDSNTNVFVISKHSTSVLILLTTYISTTNRSTNQH